MHMICSWQGVWVLIRNIRKCYLFFIGQVFIGMWLSFAAVEEPFSQVLVDCVGKTKSGNNYLFTIMCMVTRFPEAIPLLDIQAHTIIKAVIKFFTFVGFPKHVQSDQGSNFVTVFQQVLHQLKIIQHRSSAYHPQP